MHACRRAGRHAGRKAGRQAGGRQKDRHACASYAGTYIYTYDTQMYIITCIHTYTHTYRQTYIHQYVNRSVHTYDYNTFQCITFALQWVMLHASKLHAVDACEGACTSTHMHHMCAELGKFPSRRDALAHERLS